MATQEQIYNIQDLLIRGYNIAEAADNLCLCRSHLYRVLIGERPMSIRVRRALAALPPKPLTLRRKLTAC